jgi:P27 family predicted phage terminase small subunit
MRGRKPHTTAQRRLDGNPSGRPFNREEPRPTAADAAFDAVPPELVEDVDAAAEWSRLAPMLRRAGQVTLADRTGLVAACLAWSQFLAATRALRTSGLVVSTSSGDRPSPYIGIAHKALGACNKLWPELGLTPTSRARLKATPLVPGDDPFAEFDEATH